MADIGDTLATALHGLRERFGDDTFANRRRLISLLSDQFPDAKREVRAVGTAIDENVPGALAGVQRQLVGLEMDRQADRLESSVGLRIDLARQTVRAIAFALDLGPLPSVYQAGGSAPTPVPAPIPTPNPMATPSYPSMPPTPAPGPGNQWIGVSGPVQPQPAQGFVGHYPTNPTNPYAPSTPYNPYGQSTVVPPKAKMPTLTKVLIGVAILFVAMMIYGLAVLPSDNKKDDPGTATTTGQDGPGDETHDFGVAAQSTLRSPVGGETPVSIPVGNVLTTADVKRMMGQSPAPQLVDTLADPHQTTIPGAIYLPTSGEPGTFTDARQTALAATLSALPAVRDKRPLIFFCLGVKCWESYNALLRANAAGIKDLYWYRGGLQAWQASGGTFVAIPAATN